MVAKFLTVMRYLNTETLRVKERERKWAQGKMFEGNESISAELARLQESAVHGSC